MASESPVVGVLSPDELALWRAFATAWRDGRNTIPPFDDLREAGRIALRLLDALDETQARVVELDGLLGEAQELLGMSGNALKAAKLLYDVQQRGESRVAETGWKRPLTAEQLEQFRSLAESFRPGSDEAGVGPVIVALLDEVQRLKAAFVPRPVREASSLEKDFHVLYRAAERLVADLDAEKVTDLGEVKAQLRRLMPAFEECEVARRMAWHTKEGN